MNNKNSFNKNSTTKNYNPLSSAFTLFGVLTLFITGSIILVILFEQKIPIVRELFVPEFIGIIGSLFALWLIMTLQGKQVDIIGNNIDLSMIAFIIIILLLIFGNI